ncbi:Sorbose-specific phosphotransferase enzyme IIB component [Anaerococcus prevotii]|uniref:PTS system sorbose subfamily IIB component n=1 Tax=Anaerococcus prevotii (strain ATCC 9321 / DSM 20548 / JCM 6508 / NCTC 11806 / PC1) TaxID=525919 RepID=C7RFE8_ANAPD|nr:PTS sugar transporter subunit IIB [Anaerococcus prevotii]ACV28209.1 PTS system sorbose subfamily IIB component [Anaerococcus prevotii DSM 20548]SUU93763.1 Sorbose-specific phosphotransferase enzyme IIB component [Anaerococcus prevotii]
MGKVKLCRIDSRLSHGKVVEIWSKELKTETVIIANDEVSRDDFRKKVMDLTIPDDISAYYLKPSEVGVFLKDYEKDVFLIVASAQDLETISKQDIEIPEVNIGIIHMSIGKKSLTEEVAVDEDDLRIFREFLENGSDVYVRLSPYSQRMELKNLFDKN